MAIRPVLFTPNVQIYLETSSLQRVNNVPKLPGVLDERFEKLGTNHIKKTLNNAGHIDAKLIDLSEISPKKSSEISCFLLIVSWRSFPTKFPVKSADFSKNLPLKILRNLTFFRENPAKSADFSANFDFFPEKIPEIGRFFREFAPENPAKFCFFFREISEALAMASKTVLK